jgi:hypothetical protein
MRQLSTEKTLYPTIPNILYKLLEKQKSGNGHLVDWKVNSGEVVRRGDILAILNVKEIKDKSSRDKKAKLTASIKAPEDGIITIENFYESSKWPEFPILEGVEVEEQTMINNDNLWFSIHRSNTYEGRGTERLISYSYSDLIKYLFFMPSNPVDRTNRGWGSISELKYPENADDLNHDKIYLYLQIFSNFCPIVKNE